VTVAYLANMFPSPVEPYVGDEIAELRQRGVRVVTGSVRRAPSQHGQPADVCLQSLGLMVLLRAAWLCLKRRKQISDVVLRLVAGGSEGLVPRAKAMLHTWLGACYAVVLADREIDHIHVHHGYFGSWVAMVAARLLNAGFSMTLHGSDLLLRGAYLDMKLANCSFCLTVSEFNRNYILRHYPRAQQVKVVVSRLGVDGCEHATLPPLNRRARPLHLVAVGRLHTVKDHAFLARACAQLANRGVPFECSIAGEGPERRHLESLIRQLGLENQVTLLGHVARRQMDSLYDRADVVVLTSRSEGLPLVLMEAMARGKIVLAPLITGIPELVISGKTGFLYEPGCLNDFVRQVLAIYSVTQASGRARSNHDMRPARWSLDWVSYAAQVQVQHNFDRRKNLESFGDIFMQRLCTRTESAIHESFVLQQIQLPVQRYRSVSVRADGVAAFAGARDRAVFDG
jgi:colanic acid/amylovoran biosynthesis glycosyltransferase